jgi:hypothetical protein
MKRPLITTLLVLILIPHTVNSQSRSEIAIFCDGLRINDRTCEIPEGYAAIVDIYIWIYTTPWGYSGAAFAINYPDIVQPLATIFINDSIVYGYMGDFENGIEVVAQCVSGANWLIGQKILITGNSPAIMTFIPHSDPVFGGEIVYSGCSTGFAEFDYIIPFFLNEDPEWGPCYQPTELIVGVESSSWGAIKGLFMRD